MKVGFSLAHHFSDGILIRGAGTRIPTLESPHLPAPLKAYLAG